MDALTADEIFLFEGFRLDRRAGGLFLADQNGVLVPIPIGSRALDLLILLVGRQGDLVSKDEIMSAIWPGAVVEDSNLPTQISTLRRVLDRGRSNGSCIQTVAGRGYRFVAAVTHHPAKERSSSLNGGTERVEDEAPKLTTLVRASSMPAAASRRPHRLYYVAAAVGVALVLATAASWLWPTVRSPATRETASPRSLLQPLVAPRLSIVVLPFVNLSNDPDQQYFADGVTEELTTDLSRIMDLFVISRNTAFTYRNKLVDTKQIGRELGVRYVLEGSVQRSGNRVRVAFQLIDAVSDAHMWADRFDRDAADLLALQDEITTRIAVALDLELIRAEAARPTENPDALDYILRGRAAGLKPPSRESRAEQISLYERALALDPDSVEAQSLLATELAGRTLANATGTLEADISRAEDLTARALAASPNSPLPHFAKATLLRAQRRFAEAISEYEAVLAFDRNSVFTFFTLGQCKLFTGSIEETIPLIERAIRLSPRDPALGVWYSNIGNVHLLQSRTLDAIIWLEQARNNWPAQSLIRGMLASAYGLNGETERATAELAEARRLSGDDRFSSIARLHALGVYGAAAPKIQALLEATYFSGLRKAGVPEE
jgi:TolB-like protein/DNA-binding winged helix-turn-helix (wHTH) protein/Flp pilus assembly protein TadD